MVEFVEGGFDVSRHGEIAGALGVVPVEADATVEGGGPVDGNSFVVATEDIE